MIPYAAIAETADRRWTFRLLDRLSDPGITADELAEVARALEAVSDRRAVPVLEGFLTDTSRPAEAREAAGTVLRDMPDLDVEWPEHVLRRWWNGGDPILRRHALRSMDAAACPDIVRAAAADPAQPLRTTALGQMTFFFDSPADLRLKIAVLADPDPAVRETAAAILFWDEPAAAEGPLVSATADPTEAVTVEAAATLRYYPTVRVIRCLHGLLSHPADGVRRAARDSLDDIRANCLHGVRNRDPRVARHVRKWLDPVWELLAYTADELSPPDDGPYTRPAPDDSHPPPVAKVIRLLADPAASPKVLGDTLWASGWVSYSANERRRLRPILLNHPDPFVRDRGTVALAEWGDAEGLLALSADADFVVRKAATYRLGLIPRDVRIAPVIRPRLEDPRVFGVHATETLGTYVAHADPADAVRELAAIAADTARPENLRIAAVHHLEQLRAVDAVRNLSWLLAEPPAVTWGLQIAVLDAMAGLGLTDTGVNLLAGVDHLDVQAAVAGLADPGSTILLRTWCV